MEFDDLSNRVIGCAIEVHRNLGPGLLELAYEKCLAYELGCSGINMLCKSPFLSTTKALALNVLIVLICW